MKTTSILWSAIAAAQLAALPLTVYAGTDAKETTQPVTAEKAPPLPLHTIEGVGGIVITPVAYLVNPGPAGTVFGLPAASATYVKANTKNVESAVLTETLFGRLELGYAASRFGVGNLVDDVKDATTVNIPDSVVVHNFNARFLALPENSFDLPVPAVTIGASYKYNDGIEDIDNRLGGALGNIGYKSNDGVDFTLTATKAFPNVFGRPLIVTGGLRFSEAEQLGYLGFGDKYRATFEGNVVYLVTDWLGLAAEFRGKANAYQPIANPRKDGGYLVGREDNWWTIGAAFIVNPHTTVTVGWGHFGELLNTTEDKGLAVQAKYEF
ncbi:MAG: DUF3034 family protein [Chthoniobacteraceae bacterium]|nr:DUF3034 family protein [Chthoniobacteraceae bacterium]